MEETGFHCQWRPTASLEKVTQYAGAVVATKKCTRYSLGRRRVYEEQRNVLDNHFVDERTVTKNKIGPTEAQGHCEVEGEKETEFSTP